jgi:hypothetical protein
MLVYAYIACACSATTTERVFRLLFLARSLPFSVLDLALSQFDFERPKDLQVHMPATADQCVHGCAYRFSMGPQSARGAINRLWIVLLRCAHPDKVVLENMVKCRSTVAPSGYW